MGEETRICWICYEEAVGEDEDWVSPCNCCGTTKWVHKECIMAWIDRRQSGNTEYIVKCSHCKFSYRTKGGALFPAIIIRFFVIFTYILDGLKYLAGTYEILCAIYSLLFGLGLIVLISTIGFKDTFSFIRRYTEKVVDRYIHPKRSYDGIFIFDITLMIMKIQIGIPYITTAVLSIQFTNLRWYLASLPLIVLFDPYKKLTYQKITNTEILLLAIPVLFYLYKKLITLLDKLIDRIIGFDKSINCIDHTTEYPNNSISQILDDEGLFQENILAFIKIIFFPILSGISGSIIFKNTHLSNLQRTIICSGIIAGIYDIIKISIKKNHLYTRINRKVLPYNKDEL
eukprot:GHVP01003278.1.p1 GENE.GHVP01003278.1~~GHVP01003278.1.p1  ORF type:complete len:343 (+),score=27.62 GHVP01003278.1:211-1239(+)